MANPKDQLKELSLIPDHLLIGVIRRFLAREKKEDIATWLRDLGFNASRESTHKTLLPMAIERGLFKLLTRPAYEVGLLLADEYNQKSDEVYVVDAIQPEAREQVSAHAVELIVELIHEVGRRKERVHLGFGGGMTLWETARMLAQRLGAEPFLPRLTLHALSSGFDPKDPRTAPVSFMTFFESVETDIEYVALFAPAVVDISDYGTVCDSLGVREAVAQKERIDIVLTSLASSSDKHGALNKFAAVGKKQGFRKGPLRKAGRQGDLLYQPYSKTGPIDVDAAGVRAVSLFGLDELRTMAKRKNKHVVVIASPCDGCKVPKTKAVRPLLESADLKVWTKLVLDLETAKELLEAA